VNVIRHEVFIQEVSWWRRDHSFSTFHFPLSRKRGYWSWRMFRMSHTLEEWPRLSGYHETSHSRMGEDPRARKTSSTSQTNLMEWVKTPCFQCHMKREVTDNST